MFHKPDQPIMLEFVEKGSNVEIQNPVHFLPHDSHPQRVQCILLSASWPESVAETQKVLFPYLVENRPDRVLKGLCPPMPRFLMAVSDHRISRSRFFATVVLDRLCDGFFHVGRLGVPPGLFHILPT